jgi:hypothetical protein
VKPGWPATASGTMVSTTSAIKAPDANASSQPRSTLPPLKSAKPSTAATTETRVAPVQSRREHAAERPREAQGSRKETDGQGRRSETSLQNSPERGPTLSTTCPFKVVTAVALISELSACLAPW